MLALGIPTRIWLYLITYEVNINRVKHYLLSGDPSCVLTAFHW